MCVKWLRVCSTLVQLWSDNRGRNIPLYDPVAKWGAVEGLVLRLVSSVSGWVAAVCEVARDRRSLVDLWDHVVVVGHPLSNRVDGQMRSACPVPEAQEIHARRQVRPSAETVLGMTTDRVMVHLHVHAVGGDWQRHIFDREDPSLALRGG